MRPGEARHRTGHTQSHKIWFGRSPSPSTGKYTALSRQLYHFCLCFVYPRRWLVWVLGLGGVSSGCYLGCVGLVCVREHAATYSSRQDLPDEHDLFGSFRLSAWLLILARHHTTPHNEGREPGASPQLCCGRKDARSTRFLRPLWVFSQNVA